MMLVLVLMESALLLIKIVANTTKENGVQI